MHGILIHVLFTADEFLFLFLLLASKYEPDGRVMLVEFETLRYTRQEDQQGLLGYQSLYMMLKNFCLYQLHYAFLGIG